MIKRPLSILSIAGLVTLLVGILVPLSFVGAQPVSTGGQALEIGPPVLNLTADPGQTIKATISLRDVSNGSLLVSNQINDFVAGGEDGTPKIILDDSASNPYSLKSWISPLSQLTLKSKEIKNLTITINVPKTASPGGYYGVVRFTGNPPELKDTGVSLSASIGSLILLKVNGAAKEGLTVEQFFANNNGKPGSLFESAPITFVERLKNTGNIHEEPAGLVTITDMFNNKVATLGVNQPPHDILPQSIRKFESSLDSTNIGNKILFGRYKADLNVIYGANKQVVTSSITFWVIPYRLIATVIALLIGGFIALNILVKRYNRHIIGKARKR